MRGGRRGTGHCGRGLLPGRRERPGRPARTPGGALGLTSSCESISPRRTLRLRLRSAALAGSRGAQRGRIVTAYAPFRYLRGLTPRPGALTCMWWQLGITRLKSGTTDAPCGGAVGVGWLTRRTTAGAVFVNECGRRPGSVLVISYLASVPGGEASNPPGGLTSASRAASTGRSRRCAPPPILRIRRTGTSVAHPGSYSRRASPLHTRRL